jgi:DNA polymerase V
MQKSKGLQKNVFKLPLFTESVQAGFPSPADDHIETKLDLNEFLIKHPEATFFVRVTGDSMKEVGMSSGDILIVDRALEPKNGKIIVAAVNGELTVKRLQKNNGKVLLVPENKNFSIIEISEDMEFMIWGVVVNVIKFF